MGPHDLVPVRMGGHVWGRRVCMKIGPIHISIVALLIIVILVILLA
jgi:hypothetical protein